MLPPRLLTSATVAVALAAPLLAVHAQSGRSGRPAGRTGDTITAITIQQRMIIRVPRMPPGPAPARIAAASPIRWAEKKAPKCVALIDLAAASVTNTESVDLILNGGRRLRAGLGSDCRALDFYSGFYVRMTADEKLCAGRDAFRSRSGGECRIKGFKALVPKR